MEVGVFARGVIIGLSIAAPVGPIGVICIRRTLRDGRWMGLASGLGAATADAVYGSIAAFGLALVASALTTQQFLLRLIGGAFLCYLGIRAYRDRPDAPGGPDTALPADASARAPRRQGLVGAYASTFALTLTNPVTILSFVAIYAGLGLATGQAGAFTPALMVLGVFSGSVLWWFILSTGANLLRARMTLASLRWVNRVSGVTISLFGLVTLWSAIWG
ncbi:MAG: LysE family translocator [Anaerolineae bacterium]|jgi:threonine/homoserine/homoserine lactone efflux protein|nr:LysE family translocator [Anaerolineae bacterium]